MHISKNKLASSLSAALSAAFSADLYRCVFSLAMSVGCLVLLEALMPIRVSAETFQGKVVSVADGDSMTVMHGSTREKIILYGVDCPEIAQDFGPQAKKFTDEYCYGRAVSVDVRGKDSQGRTIAVVALPDVGILNQSLLQKGLAWWSDKFAPQETTYKQLQATARESHTGLWTAPNPVPPWLFRNGDKGVKAQIIAK